MQRLEHSLKRFVAMVSVVLACTPSLAQRVSAAPVKTVAVISAVGHTLTEKTIGFMVFSNDEQKVDISDWKIDDYVTEQVGALLARSGFRVVQVAYDWHEFDTHGGGLFGDDVSAAIPKRVRAMALVDGPDLYVVISRSVGPDALFQTNQNFDGLGVCRRSVLGHASTGIYAYFAISVVDGHTFKGIDTEIATSPNPGNLFGRSVPVQHIGLQDVPDSLSSLSPKQMDDVRDALKILIDSALNSTYPRIDFPR